MKVNLNILERVVIMNILPRTGSFVNVRAAKNTTKILSISKDEEKEIELPGTALQPHGTMKVLNRKSLSCLPLRSRSSATRLRIWTPKDSCQSMQ